MSEVKKQEFQAEIQQLLDIVIHSVYTDKEVFIRELISNAADACEKLRFRQSAGNEDVFEPDTEAQITVKLDEENNTITINIDMMAARRRFCLIRLNPADLPFFILVDGKLRDFH